MYGKVFDSIYDGTLAEDWRALVTFQQMLVLCDADGVLDMTPSSIARRTGIPIEHIKAGIEILENPDPWSRTPDEEGRRIKRIEEHRPWGWFIVNHQKYRDLQDYDTVRAQNRERQRRRRERLRSETDGHDASRAVTPGHAGSRHTDTDTNTNTNTNKKNTPSTVTINQFLESCKQKNEQQIRPTDAVISYSKDAGIPMDYVRLCWHEFVERHQTPTKGAALKRYKNWRQAFNNCVRGNWYKLWYIDNATGEYCLTTTGKQAEKKHKQRGAA